MHLAASGEDLMVALRAVRPGTLVVDPTGSLEGPWSDLAAEHRLARGADLVSFGRAFISNPDLVDRMQRGLLLAGHLGSSSSSYRDGGH